MRGPACACLPSPPSVRPSVVFVSFVPSVRSPPAVRLPCCRLFSLPSAFPSVVLPSQHRSALLRSVRRRRWNEREARMSFAGLDRVRVTVTVVRLLCGSSARPLVCRRLSSSVCFFVVPSSFLRRFFVCRPSSVCCRPFAVVHLLLSSVCCPAAVFPSAVLLRWPPSSFVLSCVLSPPSADASFILSLCRRSFRLPPSSLPLSSLPPVVSTSFAP